MFSVRQVRTIPLFHNFLGISHKEYTRDEKGFSILRLVDDCSPMPDPSNYDLDRLLKAGVPLQETRTDVISADISDALYALENVSNEVNDEQ